VASLNHVSSEQRDVAARLVTILPPDAYLAGGVAVAAALDHRSSLDLDVFTESTDPRSLIAELGKIDGAKVVGQAVDTLELEIDEVPTSLFRYRYPNLVEPTTLADLAIRCASVEDLTAMKLAAISGRGAAKDFWDLHALLAHRSIELAHALAEFERKYVTIDLGSVVRSLAYFGGADAEPLPRGLDAQRWTAIKIDIQRRVAEL
jgi:hypothetical protein